MLIQEAGEPHDDHMAPINTDSNYCSSITLKPYYSRHVSHETRDSDRNQLWSLNGLGTNDFLNSNHNSRFSKFEEIKCFQNIEHGRVEPIEFLNLESSL